MAKVRGVRLRRAFLVAALRAAERLRAAVDAEIARR
jgi:hypothetical protein